MNPEHLVVALCGALVAVVGLLFLVAHYLDQCAKLRAERDAADKLLASLGLRRPVPPPEGDRKL